jgi:predicted outer membrane protein
MRFHNTVLVLAIAAACAWVRPVRADDFAAEAQDGEEAALGAADVAVLQHCHDVNLMEIDLGRLAFVHGSRRVQRYAKYLVKDHAIADKKAKALAANHGQTLVDRPAPTSDAELADQELHEDLMAKLVKLDGAAFDAVYLDAMVEGHEQMAAYLSGAINSAVTDDALRALLQKLEPVVEKHARQARQLRGKDH